MGIASIIGLDPGSEKSAYVWWNGKEILEKGIVPNENMFRIIDTIWGVCLPKNHANITFAIESMVHITKGGKAIIHTLLWAGQFYHAWHGKKEFVERYKVTLALTGKNPSKESDKLVRQALIKRFGTGVTHGLKSHLWQAFGLAVVHWDHLEFQGRILK